MAFYYLRTFHFLVIWFLFLNSFSCTEVEWEVKFENDTSSLSMGDSKNISVVITHLNRSELIALNATMRIASDSNILHVSKVIHANEIVGSEWNGFFEVNAIYIGCANVFVEILRENTTERSPQRMQIDITLKHVVGGVFVKCFNVFVMIFFFIMQLNFGVVLDLNTVKSIARKPLKPCAAFVCNYTLIPLVS